MQEGKARAKDKKAAFPGGVRNVYVDSTRQPLKYLSANSGSVLEWLRLEMGKKPRQATVV